MNCSTTTAKYTSFNIISSNAPYTKLLTIPQESSQYTQQIQRKCVNPLNYQKPYPGPTNGDSCNASTEVNKNIEVVNIKNKEIEIFLDQTCD
jgi:hypothetical protein